MTLLTLLQHMTSRHAPLYFSMVRRSDCWASRDSLRRQPRVGWRPHSCRVRS
jgi:hypothetical protein